MEILMGSTAHTAQFYILITSEIIITKERIKFVSYSISVMYTCCEEIDMYLRFYA